MISKRIPKTDRNRRGRDRKNWPWPVWKNLFRGCVREALAAVNSTARIDIQGTNAWEKPISYISDDNCGNVGIIEFSENGVVAAVNAKERVRAFDQRAIDLAPPTQQDALRNLCEIPPLNEFSGVSAVFWSVGEFLDGPEDWQDILRSGAELFELELLPDSVWQVDGAYHNGLTPEVARLAIAIAGRATVRVPIVQLSEDELRLLVPKDSKYERTALDFLFSDGIIAMTHGSIG